MDVGERPSAADGPPTASVLVPVRDGARWIADALDSALAQTLPALEILVHDDGSRDGTGEVLARYGDRVSVVTEAPRGANHARNHLLRRARGEWLQYLDADDVLAPDKLERQLAAVAARRRAGEEVDLVASPCLGSRGHLLHAPRGDDAWAALLESRLGVTSANLFRREALVAAGGWDPERPAGQEYQLMQRMLRAGARVAIVPEPLATKRSVNAASVWRRDPGRSYDATEENLVTAVDFLAADGALDETRRAAAARRFFSIARWRWALGGYSLDAMAALARRLDPRGEWLHASLSPGRRLALALLRWRAFQRAFPAVHRARELWVEGFSPRRAGARPGASGARARPGSPPPPAAPAARPPPRAPTGRA